MVLRKYINTYVSKLDEKYDIFDIYKLLGHYYNKNIDSVIASLNDEINENDKVEIEKILNSYYLEKVPLYYIIGKLPFYNEIYKVSPYVLIPRKDTEILVQTAINYINNENLKTCLDLCTGSGAVGISISKNSNISHVVLSDISKDAVFIANENILLNSCKNNVSCIVSDMFENISLNNIDILVSNPPYISSDVLKTLDEYVKKEPIIALDGGEDGLFFYRKILTEAKKVLNNNAVILFEIGFDQKQALADIINNCSEYEYIECIKDIEKRDRVIVCRFHQKLKKKF